MFSIEDETNTRGFSDLSLGDSGRDDCRRKRPRTTGSRTSAPLRRMVTPEQISSAPIVRTSRRKRAVRSVSFSESLKAFAPATNTTEEVDATQHWYNRMDYDQFKRNVKQDVLHLARLCRQDSLGKVDFSQQTVVGIERYCRSTREQYSAKKARAQLIRAVLDQQAVQRATGMEDQETIRMMSELHSHSSSQQAYQRAHAFH
ncbi:expressed unknown protein [Seminavis robusta]|uniref:Uncharacterized protein n=1 Tax=Seminavis robusta TaxID=568900 RepID=A0A9N8DJY1_9STRA|nr:expressed unknown protein [Seminavis robusta]|eukprot:Sro199_g084480.1 n/a (202) ;mRNA; r:71643-72248